MVRPGPALNSGRWLEDPTHPLQITLRTYVLALSLSLGPALVPVITSLFSKRKTSPLQVLQKVLKRDLHYTGFAASITLAVGGFVFLPTHGAFLSRALEAEQEETADNILAKTVRRLQQILSSLTSAQKTLLAHIISSTCGLILLQKGRIRPKPRASSNLSPTLDLTLLLFVRAVDVFVQAFVFKRTVPLKIQPKTKTLAPELSLVRERLERERQAKELNRRRRTLRAKIDGIVFWICSARIMWCFFYQPYRLPSSYVRWISALAEVDQRIIEVLRLIRSGEWSYIKGSLAHESILKDLAKDLGFNPAWGDPLIVPTFGGAAANEVWKNLGVTNRNRVGGIPCQVVHGGVGSNLGLAGSCTANSGIRGLKAFVKALAIYIPAHFIPIILTRPRTLLRPERLFATILAAGRSATFLSTFVAAYWYGICLTRSLGFARLFPWVSYQFWDGPYGCILAGCLLCPSSIFIEEGRRRGEMALYVLPKAVRASLPHRWLRSGNRGVVMTEQVAFVLSLASLLTASVHAPDTLRGLSRWTLAFVTNGPNAGFWQRKRDFSIPATPNFPTTPAEVIATDEVQPGSHTGLAS
ncbi:hypothetical protein C8J56DRAFT_850944 [Mycena floridula]|nr:hypothetical protein C8J56DRAFT_850944 [Mycena floridula]